MFFFIHNTRMRIKDVKSFLHQCVLRTIVLPNDQLYRMSDSVAKRMRVFRNKGVVCASCGRKGTVIFMDQTKNDPKPFPNLYIKTKKSYVVMNVDHIIPKAKGGKNAYENLQPMCAPCNSRKGDSNKEIDWLRTSKKERTAPCNLK